ncbi:MAG TPA: DUF3592 domain-containing protein [Gemmataceae bacterium]|jgi:hypothetical protein|nr:DUF3592 domain-containing protein [Gemmataceae bacterium]
MPSDFENRFLYLCFRLKSLAVQVPSVLLMSAGLYSLALQEVSFLLWKKTQGTVVESETIWPKPSKDGFQSLSVNVRYRYMVDGKENESTRFTTGVQPSFTGANEARVFRELFPPGISVDVYYAPYNPWEATLNRERLISSRVQAGLGFMGLLFVIFIERKLGWVGHAGRTADGL